MARAIPAVFMRGGTSKAIMFHARDLPPDRDDWAPIFTAALGSPDPYGRQLDGMGGGVSSLSKICVLAPSSREDADIDYTFAQVAIREARVDFSGNCGNMSSAVGPFAVDEGLVRPNGEHATVRIFNTNTQKHIHARFALQDGRTRYDGDLAIPGVSGSASPIRLDFRNPGGSTTGKLLPTGHVIDRLDIPGFGPLDVSMIDAANACAFIRAGDIGLTGLELPEQLERDADKLRLLDSIRVAASVAMGIAPDETTARTIGVVPFIAFVSPAADAPILTGETIRASEIDLAARALSSGQPHRALPLTLSLCLGVAARITGTVAHELVNPDQATDAPVRIGMPSGILHVGADVIQTAEKTWIAQAGSFYRTARRLFDGRVWI